MVNQKSSKNAKHLWKLVEHLRVPPIALKEYCRINMIALFLCSEPLGNPLRRPSWIKMLGIDRYIIVFETWCSRTKAISEKHSRMRCLSSGNSARKGCFDFAGRFVFMPLAILSESSSDVPNLYCYAPGPNTCQQTPALVLRSRRSSATVFTFAATNGRARTGSETVA